MEPLPIDAVLGDLEAAVQRSGVAVLKAATGAGKTTRVPPRLWRGRVDEKVVVVEPRRLAARAAAARVADERGWDLGATVGYRIRGDDRSSRATGVLFVTEGVLLEWLQRDPFLEKVGLLIFDEFHERSVASDLALSMAQHVRGTVRNDLGIVVMSATLESAAVAHFLDGAAVIESEGRMHPVEVSYLRRADDRPLDVRVARAVVGELAEHPTGDVLVFLPGVGEIRRVDERVREEVEAAGAEVHHLYGDLPLERQRAALSASAAGRRRVILCTNVAETSVTVEGVEVVIDAGLERRLEADPATGFDRLELRRISKSSAQQRAGRAGRVGPGRCLRLWTESEQSQLQETTVPEVRRVSVAGPLLRLVDWGEGSPLEFPWFEPPDPGRGAAALSLLRDLRLVAERRDGRLRSTADGEAVVRLGLAPRLGRLFLECRARGLAEEGARLVALLDGPDLLRRQGPDWEAPRGDSDALERLRALDGEGHAARRVRGGRRREVLQEAQRILRRLGRVEDLPAPPSDTNLREELSRALLAAYPDRVGRSRETGGPGRGDGRAVLVGGRGARLARSSVVRGAELFVALDLGRASASAGEGAPREPLIFLASEIEEAWLVDEMREERRIELDPETGRPRAFVREVWRDLVLRTREEAPSREEAAEALVAAAAREPERALDLSESALQLLARLESVRLWRPELDLPPADDLLRMILPAACAGCRTLDDLRRAPLTPHLESGLSWPQRRALDELAPSSVDLPNGTTCRLTYSRGGEDPVLAAQIQRLFGVVDTPRVDGGRRAVLLHLLAPSGRPQQITSDLAGFWSGSYALVRKEMAGRYPKHPWPEDPAHAAPPTRRRR